VPPTAFQQLPLPKAGRGPVGYFQNLERRVYRGEIDLERFINNQWVCEPNAEEPALLPCPDEYLQFPQDTTAILAAIGFSPGRTSSSPPRRRPRLAEPSGNALTENARSKQQNTKDFDPDDFPRLEISPE
jgi:hypothetical protein